MEITPVLPIASQKFPQYFEGHFTFCAVFQNVCIFIPQFIAELLKTPCGTLVEKHGIKVIEHKCENPDIRKISETMTRRYENI